MSQITFKKFITRKEIQSNPDIIFIFGDNDKREGLGGQAKEMRGEPNCIGIRTKKNVTWNPSDYYYDIEFRENVIKILEDFELVENKLQEGKKVIIPLDGIGTGLARLSTNAPLTLNFIKNYIKYLIKKYNMGEYKRIYN